MRSARQAAVVLAVLMFAVVPPASGQRTNTPPNASFTWTPAQPAPGQTVTFDASGSTDAENNIFGYAWDFDGDGAEDGGGQSPTITHTYAAPGSYNVTVRVVDDRAAQDTETRTVVVTSPPEPPAPTAELKGPESFATGAQIELIAEATGDGLKYAWDLDGDGLFETDTGGVPAVQHIYNTSGDRTAGLRVTDSRGRTVTDQHKVHANSPPFFTARVASRGGFGKGRKAKFVMDAVADTSAPIDYYEWHFEDKGKTTGAKVIDGKYAAAGDTVVTKSPTATHTFAKNGVSDLTVVAHASDGQKSTLYGEVSAGPGFQKDYLLAFVVSENPMAQEPVGFVDVSTVPPEKGGTLVETEKNCEVKVDPHLPAQCVTITTPANPAGGFRSWNFGQLSGKCSTELTGLPHCTTQRETSYTYTAGGKTTVTLTHERRLGESKYETKKLSRTVSIGEVKCGYTINVRGIPVHPPTKKDFSGDEQPGCWPEITNPTTGAKGALINGSVRVGGIPPGGLALVAKDTGLRLSNGGSIEIWPSKGTIAAAPGSAPLEVVDTVFGSGKVTLARNLAGLTIPSHGTSLTLPGEFASAVQQDGPTLGDLKAVGASVKLFNSGPVEVDYDVTMPDPFNGTAPYKPRDPTGSASGRVRAAGATTPGIGPFNAAFGPLGVKNVTFSRSIIAGKGERWHGGGAIDFFGLVDIDASDEPERKPFPLGFGLTPGGGFDYAGAVFNKSPGIPLGNTGAFLDSIGFFLQPDPFVLSGDGHVTATGLIGGTGCVSIVVPDSDDIGKQAPFCDRTHAINSTGVAVRVNGQVDLVGITLPGNAYAEYVAPSHFAAGGGLDYKLPLFGDNYLRMYAQAAGVFESLSVWQFDMGGGIDQNFICLPDCVGVDASIRISSKGGAACGYPFGLPLSGYVTKSGSVGISLLDCDGSKDQVKVARLGTPEALVRHGGDPFAFPAGVSSAIRIPSGLPHATFVVRGAEGAPRVDVTGPGGFKLSDNGQAIQAVGKLHGIHRREEEKTTYVYVPRPRAGLYRVAAQEGSPAVGRISVSEGLPKRPRISARVSGRGSQRTLSYKVQTIPGQRVDLVERGNGTEGVIGRARGRAGKLRFTPAGGRGGTRRIVALVEQDGLPRGSFTVGRYRAAGPPSLGAPRVALRRRRSSLTASWTLVPGADRYRVDVETTDGRKLSQIVAGRRPRFTLDRFLDDVGATVRVRAVDEGGRIGRAGRGRAPALVRSPALVQLG